MVGLVAFLPVLPSLLSPLQSYVAAPDSSFRWEQASPVFGYARLSMVSQTWHGIQWHHDIVFAFPSGVAANAVANPSMIIEVTGDKPDLADLNDATTLANDSGMPVAVLFQEPNQPIFGKQEDFLIADTFKKFIATGDATWPLLLPMTKAVHAAMNSIQQWSHNVVKKFVITGESKRGWTAWLSGEMRDRRVVGIAPVAFDNLNMLAQLQKQKAEWGTVNPLFQPYTDAGLTGIGPSSSRLASLVRLVDPFFGLSQLQCPVLLVRGANDPFWTTDALTVYKARLPAATSLLNLPNEGHDFKDKRSYWATVAAFARSCVAGFVFPHVSARQQGSQFVAIWSELPVQVEFYEANSPSMNFSGATWRILSIATPREGAFHGSLKFPFADPKSGYRAGFALLHYNQPDGHGGQLKYSLTTPMMIAGR